jgi:hypothetical protein
MVITENSFTRNTDIVKRYAMLFHVEVMEYFKSGSLFCVAVFALKTGNI